MTQLNVCDNKLRARRANEGRRVSGRRVTSDIIKLMHMQASWNSVTADSNCRANIPATCLRLFVTPTNFSEGWGKTTGHYSLFMLITLSLTIATSFHTAACLYARQCVSGNIFVHDRIDKDAVFVRMNCD